jgi:uncharacterized protein (DUF1778 family)
MSKDAIIPIRFTQEEKIYLQTQANISGVSLSAFVRSKSTKGIPKKSKAKELLELLETLNITDKEIDDAFEAGIQMRKNFNLISTK